MKWLLAVAQTIVEFYEIAHFLSKTTSFKKNNYPPFIKKKNYRSPPEKKLHPQISPFIKYSIILNNRDPCQLAICSLFVGYLNDLKTPLCQASMIQSVRYHQAGLVNLLWAVPLYWKRSSDIRKVLSRNFTGEKWCTHNRGKNRGKLLIPWVPTSMSGTSWIFLYWAILA